MNLKEEYDALQWELRSIKEESNNSNDSDIHIHHSKLLAKLAEVKSKIVKQNQIYVDVAYGNDFTQQPLMDKVSVKLDGRTPKIACMDLIQQVSKDHEIPETKLSWEWFTQLESIENNIETLIAGKSKWEENAKARKVNRTCKKCNGNMKPSKGLMNIHNISKSGEGEFETKLEGCLKCESCGHSYIPTTERKQVDFDSLTSTFKYIDNILKTCGLTNKEYVKDNFNHFIEMLTKSSKFAHKAHIELKKRM